MRISYKIITISIGGIALIVIVFASYIFGYIQGVSHQFGMSLRSQAHVSAMATITQDLLENESEESFMNFLKNEESIRPTSNPEIYDLYIGKNKSFFSLKIKDKKVCIVPAK